MIFPLRPCRPRASGTIISARSFSDVASVNAASFLHLLAECHGRLVVLGGYPALRPESEHVLPHLESLVCFSLHFIQLRRLACILGAERDWTRRASLGERLPPLRCSYERNHQLESLALPWVTGVVGEAAAEHAHGVRQGVVMGLVVLLRVRDVVVMDKAATVDFLRCGSLGFFQAVENLRQRRRRDRLRDRIIVVLDALGVRRQGETGA